MQVFSNYARYYDLLYKDKDYKAEVGYIDMLLKVNSRSSIGNLLDLGCGTGLHDIEFAKRGFNVTGVDFSEEMVERANELKAVNAEIGANLEFVCGDIRNLVLNKKFDAVTSLFHVMSYQNTNNDVNAAFKTAHLHLQKNGLFVFDFWYGPAVLTTRPETRVKRMADKYITVTRLAEPELHINRNVVDVNYEVWIENKENNEREVVKETHSMRYFFLPEIEQLATTNGFKLLIAEEWLSRFPLSEKSWGACVVLEKIKD